MRSGDSGNVIHQDMTSVLPITTSIKQDTKDHTQSIVDHIPHFKHLNIITCGTLSEFSKGKVSYIGGNVARNDARKPGVCPKLRQNWHGPTL